MTTPRVPACHVLRAHPLVLTAARRLAGGDVRRLRVNPDASVTVTNQPRQPVRLTPWTRWP